MSCPRQADYQKRRSSPYRESCGEIESAFLVLNEVLFDVRSPASLLNVDRPGLD
jgi:hypothetical protein